MANIASMPDLPSSDEEDEDYDPSRDPTARDDEAIEAAAAARRAQAGIASGRRRFVGGKKRKKGDDDGGEEEEDEDEDDDEGDGREGAAAAAGKRAAAVGKRAEAKARVDAAWEAISSSTANGGGAASAVASLLAPIPRAADVSSGPTAMSGVVESGGGATAKGAVSLASLCAPAQLPKKRPTATATKAPASSKEAWLAKMGLGGSRPPNIAPASAAAAPVDEERKSVVSAAASDPEALAVARAALAGAALAAAAAKDHGVVRVTETKRFAGKDVEVTRAVKVGEEREKKKETEEKEREKSRSPAAATTAAKAKAPLPNAAAVGRSGLDATLAALDAAQRRVNVVGKTRSDWASLKASDAAVDDELEKYKKGGDAHVERKAFLARAERAAYERERDARLNSDVRTRGRL